LQLGINKIDSNKTRSIVLVFDRSVEVVGACLQETMDKIMAYLFKLALWMLILTLILNETKADCIDNDNMVTQSLCDPKYEKVCIRNNNGTYHEGCLTCKGIVEYDCNSCTCKVKTGWIAGFAILGAALCGICLGCCCFCCSCCPWFQYRARRQQGQHHTHAANRVSPDIAYYRIEQDETKNGRDYAASINPVTSTTTRTTIPVAPVVDPHQVTVVAGAPQPSAPPISGPGSPEYSVG